MSCHFSLKEVVAATQGQVLSEVHSSAKGLGTDTRKDLQGELFVALKGEHFDAHKFLDKAVEQRAYILVIHEKPDNLEALKPEISIVLVDDTLKALQDLANFWRKKLKAKVIAITGSNGKTTTKEFAAALTMTQFNTHMSPGSFNNHWGVPLSLLSADTDSEVIILEMGMNHAGELTELCKIAEPDICLVTNVGRAHVGPLGSIENVAQAKEEIYQACPNAIKIFNLDNKYTLDMFLQGLDKWPSHLLRTYSSSNPKANIILRAEKMTLDGLEISGEILGEKGRTHVKVFGRQNVSNLMAAAALAAATGLSAKDIWSKLSCCKSIWGRGQWVDLKNGAKVLFDAYNANPDSMKVLFKNLFELPMEGKKFAVLGDMLELGDQAAALHQELGKMLGPMDLEGIWFIGSHKGDFEAGIGGTQYEKKLILSDTYEQSLAIQLSSMLNPGDIVVMKGSRGMKLEQVLESWDTTNF